MKHGIISPSYTRVGVKRSTPARFWESAAWLFRYHAERWRERARFYERYRNYFPRLSSGRFIERCRELEAVYRGLAAAMFAMPTEEQWVLIRPIVTRRKQGRESAPRHHATSFSIRQEPW